MPLLITWQKFKDGIAARHDGREAYVRKSARLHDWHIADANGALFFGAEASQSAARKAAEAALELPHPGTKKDPWRVMRDGATRRNSPRLVMAGLEAMARARYAKEAAALRQGEVKLLAPDGTIVERVWAPRLRTRW